MSVQGLIDADGFSLKYRIEGTGMPALVIGDSTYYPRTFAGSIREHLQLIFVDHRGFVPPPSDDLKGEEYPLDTLLNDIETVRQALQLHHFVVVGHSGHAFVALAYAKTYSQYVSHVVLIGASPDYSPATAQARFAYFEENATADRKTALAVSMAQLPARIEAEPDRRFVHMCVCAGPLSWYDYTFDASPLWAGVYTNMPAIDHLWGVVFRDIDITQGLDQLDKPIFLALGKYDYLTGLPFLWDQIKTQFRDLTIRIFDQSAHTPQLEEADLFNQELIRWIQQP